MTRLSLEKAVQRKGAKYAENRQGESCMNGHTNWLADVTPTSVASSGCSRAISEPTVVFALNTVGTTIRSMLSAGAFIGLVLSGCAVTGPVTPGAPAAGSMPALFTFAVIGDLGYLPQEEPAVDAVHSDLNRDASLAFVVHLGDLSAPLYSCTDELRKRRLGQFQASVHPLVLTPGDNDWTDCHAPAVKGGDPLERLKDLRSKFFPGDRTLGQRTFALKRQSADPAFAMYRENVRWDLAGVTFLTLHNVASNNGLGRTPEGDAEYVERNKANLDWLRQGFAHAKANNSRAVMVIQQANLFPEFSPFPGKPQTPSGLTEIREQLEKESKAFGKTVVLVHGDSHYFRIDKPLSPMRVRNAEVVPSLENFTRVETFGSPYHHWLHVTVDTSDPNVFTFRQRIVVENLAKPQR